MTGPTQESHVIKAAAELAPQIIPVRDELETLDHLPESLVEALDEAGLFQINLPQSMGGTETDPITALCAIEELSKVDGAVGWCALISSKGAQFGSTFGFVVAEEEPPHGGKTRKHQVKQVEPEMAALRGR